VAIVEVVVEDMLVCVISLLARKLRSGLVEVREERKYSRSSRWYRRESLEV